MVAKRLPKEAPITICAVISIASVRWSVTRSLRLIVPAINNGPVICPAGNLIFRARARPGSSGGNQETYTAHALISPISLRLTPPALPTGARSKSDISAGTVATTRTMRINCCVVTSETSAPRAAPIVILSSNPPGAAAQTRFAFHIPRRRKRR